MNVSDNKDLAEKEKAEQFIAETPLMDGIENVRVELGEDQTGEELGAHPTGRCGCGSRRVDHGGRAIS